MINRRRVLTVHIVTGTQPTGPGAVVVRCQWVPNARKYTVYFAVLPLYINNITRLLLGVSLSLSFFSLPEIV